MDVINVQELGPEISEDIAGYELVFFIDAGIDQENNYEIKELIHGSLRALITQQELVANELNTSGQLKLKPGFSYEFTLESFCVQTGAVRPIKGDGLFLGDIEGPAKAWLPKILSQYKSTNITQNEA